MERLIVIQNTLVIHRGTKMKLLLIKIFMGVMIIAMTTTIVIIVESLSKPAGSAGVQQGRHQRAVLYQ